MHYIEETKNIYKKYDVIFNKQLLSDLQKETVTVKKCFTLERNKDELEQDATVSNVRETQVGYDVMTSYDKEFKTKLYFILNGILENDEMSKYELLDLYEEYKTKDDNKTIDEDGLKDYKTLLKALRIIKFNLVSSVNIHSQEKVQRFLEGIQYSRVNVQKH